MKVKLRSILRTTDTLFDAFQQNQIIFQAGNTLAIKQFNKSMHNFIPLTKQLINLYSFKPTPNKKGCFTAEKLNNDKIYISYYNFKKQRKTICLSDSHNFFPTNIVQRVQLLVDQFDSFLVYGYASTYNNHTNSPTQHNSSTDNCIFLIDFNKMKIISIGYVSHFNDIKVKINQNLMLSLCYNNTIRSIHVYNGYWQTEQKILKKLGNINIIRHQIISGDILLICTKNVIYFLQQQDVIQTINIFQNNNNNNNNNTNNNNNNNNGCKQANKQKQASKQTNTNKQEPDQVIDLIKANKVILILTKNQKIKIFHQDHDQLTYIFKGNLQIKLKQNQKINKIISSTNSQQFILRTNNNQIFIWKIDELQSRNQLNYEFQKIQSSGISQQKGSISLASGKQTALLSSDYNIHLWDLQKNMSILQFQFNKYQKSSQKALYAATINPDGNSLICAFEDKIKIYKILLTKLKFVAEFNIKRCKQLVYSHGGQYVACKYGKGINSSIIILNTLRMSQMLTFKTHSQPIYILWNQHDDQLIITTDNNQVTTYKINQLSPQKTTNLKIPQKINLVRIDYQTKRILVSTDNQIYVIDKDNIQKTIKPNINKFNYIYPLHGMYFATSKDGSIFWSNTLTFQNYYQLPVFINHQFNIIYRNGNLLAFNSFKNITIIQCIRDVLPAKKQLLKNTQDVVFVEKHQINLFFQKIKNLQSMLENLQNVTTVKIQEERRKYDEAMELNTKKFNEEITFLQKRFQQVNNQKIKQEKQNSRVFQDIQSGQIKSVNDLQRMYDRKLKIQRQKYMQLQQKNIQQKIHFQKLIYQLQKRYHQDISKIRSQYSQKLQLQYRRLEQTRQNDLQYKKKMQYKLIQLQQQSDITMFQLQKNKDDKIKQLTNTILKLQNLYDNSKVQAHNQEINYFNMEKRFKNMENQLKKTKQRLLESQSRTRLLQQQIQKDKILLQQKNTIIAQHQHQINGLQKAKYVLSFRTTQIRKQLQPKQNLIDKLKSEMFKLDQQFKQQKKKTFQYTQKIQKLQKLNKIIKQQNTQYKLKLQNKQRLYDQISSQIFTIVNEMDQKQWSSAFIKLYQNYIKQKQQNFKKPKNKSKDATSQQINRHLIHLQQSLLQVTTGNQKILKGKDIDVMRKMKQNAQLVYDLNIMRKKQNDYLKQLKQKNTQIAKLKRQLYQETNKTTTRAHTAKSTARRMFSREKIPNDFNGFQLSFKRDNQILFDKRQLKTRQSRSRVSSGYKTMILKSTDKKQSARFFDLAKQLESAKGLIHKQEKIIQEMNHRLLQNTIQ